MQRRLKARVHKLERIRDMRIDEELTQEEYLPQKSDLSNQLATLRHELDRQESLGQRIATTIAEKLDLLEQASRWHEMAVAARKGFLRQIAKEAFLTLETLEFAVDAVLATLAAIEPLITSSEKQKCPSFRMSIPAWQGNQETIRTLARHCLKDDNLVERVQSARRRTSMDSIIGT